MKKIKPKGLSFALSLSFCVIAVLILFPSCDLFKYKRIFPDAYYDDNFIEKIGFAKAIASNATLPEVDPVSGTVIPPSGLWDFAWRYEHYLAEETPYPYMTLSEVADAGYETVGGTGFTGSIPQGLLATSQVFRLVLENLVSDGDFEGVTPLANWNSNLDTTAFAVFEGSGSISRNSLQIDISNTGEFAKYSINLLDSTVDNTNYNLVFKWNASELAPIARDKVAYVNDRESSAVSFSNKNLELVTFLSKTSNVLTFEYQSGFSVIIDDLSLKRSLSKPKLRLRLSPGDTEPALMNMLYRFSVWVCADPLASLEKSPYHLSGFTLNIEQLQTNEIDSMTIAAGVYNYNPSFSGWRKITAWVSDGGNPQFPEDSLTPVLELVISLADSLPGRVLLAQPELRAYPDGY
ncbi:MAG TPA: hypothetical protein VJ861_11050 [Treponemataceae bacterium]|nr:hypothetical protein [Treponemataceae bacterium]